MSIKYYKQETAPADAMVTNSGDRDLVSKVKGWKEDSEGWVGTWESKQDTWHKLRMRIKKTKDFPFPGCSNIRMPTIETKLRKLKASLHNVIFGIRPIVSVIPGPTGNFNSAKKIEKFLDWLIMDVIKIKPKAVIAIDQTLEKGFYLLKPHWRVETTTRIETLDLDEISLEEAVQFFNPQIPDEQLYPLVASRLQIDTNPMVVGDNIAEVERVTEEILAGKDEVKFELQDVLYNYPDVSLCSPERIYVPTTSGYDPQGCQYVIHEFLKPLDQIKENVKNNGWSELALTDIELKKSIDLDDKNIDVLKDEREGIERLQSEGELVRIWETYCWEDINGDGVREKAVITIAPDFSKVLRKISLPFYSGKYPFVKLFYELIDDRWFSHRGIPELIEDIVKEIDITHMQKIDYQTMTNTPMFAFKAGQIGEENTQFVFGQGIPVRGMEKLSDTIAPLHMHNSNIDYSYQNEQMILETKIEELIGQTDYGLQSMINKRQPRTASEVGLQAQSNQNVFGLDAGLMIEQFSELFNWIFDLWVQYGDDSVAFNYFGKDGLEELNLTREEVQGKYKITVRGNDQNTNPQVKKDKATFILQDTYAAMQAGLVGPEAVNAARKRAMQSLDIDGYEEFLQPPKPVAPPDEVKLKADDLTDGELIQVLQKRGINPDVQGRKLNEDNRREELKFEQLAEVAKVTKGGRNGQTE